MAGLAAVETHDFEGIRLLDLLLGAALGDVTNLVAVAALGKTAIDDFTGVAEALNVLVDILRPHLPIPRARGVPLEAVGDRVRLAEATLKIHVGESGSQGLLNGDEPQRDILGTESALQIRVRSIRRRLDVDLDGLLNIVNVALLDSTLDESPGFLGGHIRKVVAIDLARILALADRVAYIFEQS